MQMREAARIWCPLSLASPWASKVGPRDQKIHSSRRIPGRVTGQYLGRDVRTLDPLPPRDRILKCTKTEEFSSLNGKKGAEAGFRSRVGGRAYVKCTGWSGVGCEWAEMAEIQKKQNPTSVDRSRPRGHLGCKGGCLEYKRELLGAKKWPESGDA